MYRGTSRPEKKVIHVGQHGDYAGGIAQVVNVYLTWRIPQLEIAAWRTTRGRRDFLAPWFSLVTLGRLIFAARRQDSLLVFHLSQGGSWLREGTLLRIARRLGWRSVAQIHGSGFVSYAKRHSEAVRKVLEAAERSYVLSDDSAAAISQLLGSNGSVVRIRNLVSMPESSWKSTTIVFGGSVGRRKGVDTLVAAWESASLRLPNWRLIVAGPHEPGFILPPLERMQVTGALSNREVGDLLSKALVAVLPSRAEALPMFLLEAMSHGCVPVSTEVGQIKELVEDIGVTVPAGDSTLLAGALISLCNSEDLAARGQAARRRVSEQYSEDTQRQHLVKEWMKDLEPRRIR